MAKGLSLIDQSGTHTYPGALGIACDIHRQCILALPFRIRPAIVGIVVTICIGGRKREMGILQAIIGEAHTTLYIYDISFGIHQKTVFPGLLIVIPRNTVCPPRIRIGPDPFTQIRIGPVRSDKHSPVRTDAVPRKQKLPLGRIDCRIVKSGSGRHCLTQKHHDTYRNCRNRTWHFFHHAPQSISQRMIFYKPYYSTLQLPETTKVFLTFHFFLQARMPPITSDKKSTLRLHQKRKRTRRFYLFFHRRY